MSVLFTPKYSLYKRYHIDIWGLFKNNLGMIGLRYPYFRFLAKKRIKKAAFFYRIARKIQFVSGNTGDRRELLKTYFKEVSTAIAGKVIYYEEKYFHKSNLALKCYGKRLKQTIWFKNMQKFLNTEPSKKSDWLCWYFYSHHLKLKRRRVWYRYSKFIYDIRLRYKKNTNIILKKDFACIRLVQLYYVMYTYRQFRRMAKKAKYLDGLFEENYIYLLECKLPAFIYRTSLMGNMFETINFVKNNNVWVNKFFVPFIFYGVKCMIPVGFRILFKGYIYWSLYKRLIRKALMFNRPKHMYISLHLFIIYMLKKPRKKDIIYPFAIDIYRACNIAN